MLNASQIISLIPQDGSLLFLMTKTKEGQLTVVVDPKYPKTSESTVLKEALSPKTITGTPEELDAGFMEYLSKTVASANNLKEALEKIEAETKAAIDKAKAESAKRVAEASKSKTKSSSSPVKSTTKTTSTPSPTQAVLGENKTEDETEGEEGQEEKPAAAETKKEEAKPEAKVPVSLF